MTHFMVSSRLKEIGVDTTALLATPIKGKPYAADSSAERQCRNKKNHLSGAPRS
jgi:hypothetical protein